MVSKTNNVDGLPHSSQLTQLPVLFWGILVLASVVRLVGITRPLLGNFSTKNIVYAMIARNWVEGRASLWYPTLDYLIAGHRSVHMLEFPFSAYLTGLLWATFGGSLEIWGRATSIAFSVAAVAIIFLFVRSRHGQTAALGAAFVMAVAPVSIIYGQAFTLDASIVFFTIATFYALDRWLSFGGRCWLVWTGVFLSLLLLTKITMLVVLLPLCVMVVQSDRKLKLLSLSVIALSIVPAALWYIHASNTAGGPMADRVFYSVRESASVHMPPHPLLWSFDFYKQILDDLSGIVLTPVGFTLVVFGLFDHEWRKYIAWLGAMVVLVLLLPLKFYEMNYYDMALLPPLCVMAGLGWKVIHDRIRPSRSAIVGLALLMGLFSIRYAAKPAFLTPHEDRAVVVAAETIRDMTDENEPIVTMHGSVMDVLYYSGRPGWNVPPDEADLALRLDEYRRFGAKLIVVVGRISHHDVPLLAEKASSVWSYRPHCFYEAVAHCFETSQAGKKCGLGPVPDEIGRLKRIADGEGFQVYRLPEK